MAKMCRFKILDYLDNNNCVNMDVIFGILCYEDVNSFEILYVGVFVFFKENKLIIL